MAQEFREEISEIANKYYSGNLQDAFPYWALSCLLADQELDNEKLREHVALGDGDLGIDGYWIDEPNRRLILLQAKGSGRVSREDAASFRAAIQALIDEEYVRSRGNSVLQEVYPDLLEVLLDDSYTIQAVLACGGTVNRGARNYSESGGSQDWQFQLEDVNHSKEMHFQVHNERELASRRDELLRSIRVIEPRVSLPIAVINDHPSFHHMGGDIPAVQATVPAKVLAEAYDCYRSDIFRYNPRGPLSSNKVNKEIERTLKESQYKPYFHLLNNGLTAICDTFVYREDTRELEVTNCQVVNGCQTVFTLHRLRKHVSDEVKVSIRIVEGLNKEWAKGEISKASNYQTAVKPEQLASLGQEHDKIAEKLARLEPPWFYEKQKGYERFLDATQRTLHRQRFGNRKVSASDVGQFGTAFLGNPILAKYDLQRLFDRSGEEGEILYRAIFIEENQAEQMLLPVIVGQRVQRAVKERIRSLSPTNGEGQEGFSELNWLPFARIYITALIGQQLKSKTHSSREGLLPADASRECWQTIDEWFDDMFSVARDAVEFYIEVQKEADKLHNLRNFFRDSGLYNTMVKRVMRRIS